MEIEVSRNLPDCPGYWQITLVANYQHVVHLDVDRAIFGACRLLITSRATLDGSCWILELAIIRTKAILEDKLSWRYGQSERSI